MADFYTRPLRQTFSSLERRQRKFFFRMLLTPDRCFGFTLVETLLAVVVLALLMVIVLQISSSTLQATHRSHQEMKATQAERMVFDALENDLANIIIQNGMTVFCVNPDSNGNTVLAFLTECRGPVTISPYSNYRCMAVAYQLESNRITRRATPILWSTTSDTLLSQITGAATMGTASVLAANALRFQAVAVLDTGAIVSLSQISSSTTSAGQVVTNSYSALILANPLNKSPVSRGRSLIVGIATLDAQTLGLPGVNASLLTSPATGKTPFDQWSGLIDSGSLASFPEPALAALQFGQRAFLLR